MKQSQNARSASKNSRRRVSLLFASALLSASLSFGAEHFGDIAVTPQSLASGETHHGYREFRILLENQSYKNTHKVTLIYPERSYNSGNNISRLSRSVVISPA